MLTNGNARDTYKIRHRVLSRHSLLQAVPFICKLSHIFLKMDYIYKTN